MNEVTDDKWQCQRDDKGWEQTEKRKQLSSSAIEFDYTGAKRSLKRPFFTPLGSSLGVAAEESILTPKASHSNST